MDELIKLQPQTINGNTVETVSARELHEFLGNGDMFANWIKHRVEKYGFVENQDFVSFLVATKKPNGGRPSQEYFITLDMAKQLAMSSREIATLTGKKHYHVVRDIEILAAQLEVDISKFGGILSIHKNSV